jgi:succinate dehydrogenase/fumarate reductase flavoprotein subunit
LRAVLIVLSLVGVGIFVGFGFLAMEVYNRATTGGRARAAPENATTAEVAQQGHALTLPAGAEITDMTAVGNRLVFTVRGVDGGLYVLNPQSGEVTRPVRTE